MRNPFRSEAAAFRFLLLTLLGFTIVGIAAKTLGTLPAVVVWMLVTTAAVVGYIELRAGRTMPSAPAHVGGPDERRIIVVAPVQASALRRLASDSDAAQSAARRRAVEVAASLRAPKVVTRAVVGDDPVLAVGDALRTFGGDEIVVLPGDDSLAEHLRERYALPVSYADA